MDSKQNVSFVLKPLKYSTMQKQTEQKKTRCASDF